MSAADAVEMYVALMNFTGAVHPNQIDNVNQVGACLLGRGQACVLLEAMHASPQVMAKPACQPAHALSSPSRCTSWPHPTTPNSHSAPPPMPWLLPTALSPTPLSPSPPRSWLPPTAPPYAPSPPRSWLLPTAPCPPPHTPSPPAPGWLFLLSPRPPPLLGPGCRLQHPVP